MATEKPAREFRVPRDLLKLFEAEVRFVPQELHPNGYIIFDRMMLQKVLLSDDVRVRRELVEQLEQLDKSGGQLVIVNK